MSTDRQRKEWIGGLRVDWSQAPAVTNREIEDAAKRALSEVAGYAWRAGDTVHLFGGRVS